MLYDEAASPEKVARMQKAARETTSLETGVRLTGFQVSSLIFALVLFLKKPFFFLLCILKTRSTTTSPANMFVFQNHMADP